MNNKYAYRENDVLVNTDKGIEPREYVDNFDNILRVENNIEVLENQIKVFENTLNDKIDAKKRFKFVFVLLLNCSVVFTVLLSGIALQSGVGFLPILIRWLITVPLVTIPAFMFAMGIAGQDVRRNTIEKLENRISVCKYELEQEKQDLNILKKQSKKIEIPKDNEIKTVLTDYVIRNLKHKLSVVESFKENTERYIAMYQSDKRGAILKELEEKYKDRYVTSDLDLIEFLILEHQKGIIEKENIKGKTKSKNKR